MLQQERQDGSAAGDSEIDRCLQRFLRDDGDQAAAAELVERLYPLVAKILAHRLPAQVALEDVAQQVFLKMFAKLRQFKGDVPLEHWVSKIVVNACLNAMRGRRLKVELRRSDLSEAEDAVLDDLHAFEQADHADHADHADDAVAGRDLLSKLLECLSPKERLAIELTELEGHSSKEAANLLGTTAIAVRVRVARARAKMRRRLEDLQEGEA
ncbi:MAG: sigma-70 family RNA polymerase sigma factor [Verrucomicrobia bacterium]|nr:sigma-70 family RNA polymerase sigma factor [Verrucomicrobiota bacterium]